MIQDHIRVNWAGKRAYDDVARAMPGVVGAWWLGEPVAALVAIDQLGGNPGAYTGAPTLAVAGGLREDLGTALALNGTSQYVSVPRVAALDVGDAWSMVAIYKRGATGASRAILSRGNDGAYVRVDSTGHVQIVRSGVATVTTSTTVLDTAWHVIFAGKSGASARIEIDGEDVTGAVTNSTMGNPAGALLIGADRTAADVIQEYGNGTLMKVVLVNRLLTPAESARVAVTFLQGEFGGPFDDLTPRIHGNFGRNVGRNIDRSGDATGEMTVDQCDNADGYFTPNRNLAPATLDSGIDWLNTTALTGIGAAATSVAWAADPATGGGARSGRLSLSATLNSHVWFDIPGVWRAGQPVSIAVQLKGVSGNANIVVGIASKSVPSDIAVSTGTIAGGYGPKTATLTPAADRSDLVGFIRTTTASAAVVGVAQVQVNPGAAPNAYIEGPTYAMLKPGVNFHWYATSAGADYPRFFGTLVRMKVTPDELWASFVVQDPRRSHDLPIDLVVSKARHSDYRAAVLDRAIAARSGAYRNLCVNSSFEDPWSTAPWVLAGGAARSSSWAAHGTYSLSIPLGGSAQYTSPGGDTFRANRYYRASVRARAISGSPTLQISFGVAPQAVVTTPVLTTTDATYSVIWKCLADTLYPVLRFVPSVAGVYVDDVMITEGLPSHDWTPYETPIGRQENFASVDYSDPTFAPLWKRGWTNLVANPEALTDVAGWSNASSPLFGDNPVGSLTATQLTVGAIGSTQSATTASITPGANRLVLVAVCTAAPTPGAVTLAGNGLTYVQVNTYVNWTNKITLFRAMGASPTAGAITITVAGSGNTTIVWDVWEFWNVDTSGTNGSGAVVQSVIGGGTSTTSTSSLAAFASANNAGISFHYATAGTGTPTVPTAFLHATTGAVNYEKSMVFGGSSWTYQPLTWSTSGLWLTIGAEIKAGTPAQPIRTGASGFNYVTIAALHGQTVGGDGVAYALTGTRRAGRTYYGRLLGVAQTGTALKLGLGSAGTPTDYAEVTIAAGDGNIVAWTPLADRTDAVLYLRNVAGSGNVIDWESAGVYAGQSDYARTGFTSPAALSESSSITVVAGGVSRPTATRIVTYAVAGSGAILDTRAWAVLPGTMMAVLQFRLVSGGPSVAFGLGDPLGDSPDAVSQTITLTTSWQRVPLTWRPTRGILPLTRTVRLYAMTPTATAVTFDVADEQLGYGTALQPYYAEEAVVDTAETDILPARALVGVNAMAELSALNQANLGIHQMVPLMVRPWWHYVSRARRSLAAKTVLQTLSDLTAVVDMGDFEQELDAMAQGVIVTYSLISIDPVTGAATAPVAVVAAVNDTDPGARIVTIDGTVYLNGPSPGDTTAQEIADLELRRLRDGRNRPTVVVTEANPTAVLGLAPDDLVALDSNHQGLRAARYLVLTVDEKVSQGGRAREVALALEEFVV